MKTLRIITLLSHVGALVLVLAIMHRDRVSLETLNMGDAWGLAGTQWASR